jgi:hypothetical protein
MNPPLLLPMLHIGHTALDHGITHWVQEHVLIMVGILLAVAALAIIARTTLTPGSRGD